MTTPVYVPYHALNKQQWDACIARADNGLIYSTSVYLDAMCKHWDGLVLGNYEAVMPLTFNRKYGLHYLYQPPFTASLGVFGQKVTKQLVNIFLDSIPAKFGFWDISLNHGNFFPVEGYQMLQRQNYILSLEQSYDTLYAGYRENIRRNIKKCSQLQCRTDKNFPVQEVLQLAIEQTGSFSNLSQTDFDNFARLYAILHTRQQAITYGIRSSNGDLLASCVFFYDAARAYYILVGNHPNGRTIGASHALIDAFIKDHAGTSLLLDFEGSDLRNLAFFYSGFGAVTEFYPGLKMNRLPWWARWAKQ